MLNSVRAPPTPKSVFGFPDNPLHPINENEELHGYFDVDESFMTMNVTGAYHSRQGIDFKPGDLRPTNVRLN